MIKEIFNQETAAKQFNLSKILFDFEIIQEAETAEDGFVFAFTENLKEEHPTCTSEDELREYIRSIVLKRKCTHAFLHCAATQPTATVSSIMNYWKNTLKWKNVGYHIIIGLNGFTVLSNFNNITNGVAGYNQNGIHCSYIGGIDKNGKPLDTRNDLQKRLIKVFCEEVRKLVPKIKVLGHNEVAAKACPSYSVKEQYPLYWTGK